MYCEPIYQSPHPGTVATSAAVSPPLALVLGLRTMAEIVIVSPSVGVSALSGIVAARAAARKRLAMPPALKLMSLATTETSLVGD